MKYPCDLCDDARLGNEGLRESGYVINYMRRTHRAMDANHQNSDFSKIVSYSKQLNSIEKSILRDILHTMEYLFNRDLGTWKTKHVGIQLHPGAKNYHAKP